MRVLLRDEKGCYYKCEREWTVCAGSALDFKGSFQAIEFAWDNGFSKVEVVLWFDDPAYDISLPVQPCPGKKGKLKFVDWPDCEANDFQRPP